MALYDFTNTGTPVLATAASAENTGSAVTADGATMTAGGTDDTQVHLRFDTVAVLPDLDTHSVIDLYLRVKVAANDTLAVPFEVWREQFGASITAADYNNGTANNTPASRRYKVGVLAPAATYASGTVLSLRLPSDVLHDADNAFTDLTIRAASTPGADDTLVIHGSSATTPADRPRLNGIAVPLAELDNYRQPAHGDDTFVAFGMETTEGVPVKPTVLVSVTEHSLAGFASNIASGAVSRNRSRPIAAAADATGAGGSVMFEITPERWVMLLMGMFKIHSTSGPTTIDGVATYVHTLRVRERYEVPSFTTAYEEGDFIKVQRGTKVGGFDFSSQLGTPMTGSMSLASLEEWHYDKGSAGDNLEYILGSTAAYDSINNSFATRIRATVSMGNGAVRGAQVPNVSLSLQQSLSLREGHDGKRHPSKVRVGGFSVGASFTMEYTDEALILQQLGIPRNTFPARPQMEVILDSLEFEVRGILGGNNQKLKFTSPKALVMVAAPSQAADQVGSLQCELMGFNDDSKGGSMEIELTCSHPASFFDPSTDLITVVPPEQRSV